MSKKHAKRFYKDVSLAPELLPSGAQGFCVKLDGRTLRTPGKKPLILPNEYVAGLVAKEWDAQVEHIQPELMPCTRLLNVAMERTPDNREGLAEEVRKYASTDLLCYREGELRVLTERQATQWDPILDWASQTHQIDLIPTSGLMAIEQEPESLDRVYKFSVAQDDISLTLLTHFTAVFGSAILAMSVIDKYLTAEKALELSRLDEIYQIELWGQDEEAQERTEHIKDEIISLALILA